MGTPYPGPRVVSLVDGSLSWSDSADYKLDCLARTLLNDYSPLMRAQMLAQLATNNGEAVAEKLRATMAAIEEGAAG